MASSLEGRIVTAMSQHTTSSSVVADLRSSPSGEHSADHPESVPRAVAVRRFVGQAIRPLAPQYDGADLKQPIASAVPFSREGLGQRLAPFAVLAGIAELSVLLPPGPQSLAALAVSVGLLLAVASSCWLPWHRIPSQCSVLVPLGYVGSVLALTLATGQTTSGVGIVILLPLIWTALFHRRWESFVVVGAVVSVEVITAFLPSELPEASIARRAFFWAGAAIVVVVTIHRLRDRARLALEETTRLQEQLKETALIEDRARIGEHLYDAVIHRLFGLALHLAGTAKQQNPAHVAERLQVAIDEVDGTIREMRSAVYDVSHKV